MTAKLLGAIDHEYAAAYVLGALLAIIVITTGAVLAESLYPHGWKVVFVVGLATGHAGHLLAKFIGRWLGRVVDESR